MKDSLRIRLPRPRKGASLEDYSGLEALIGATIGLLAFIAGTLGWYGVATSKGRRSGLAWIAPVGIVALLSLIPLAYFISLYAGEAETEARFFIVLVGSCAAAWIIAVVLYRRWKKDSLRRGSNLSGTGLL